MARKIRIAERMTDLQPDIGPKQRYPRPDANFVDLDHADCHEAQL
jgi:hypothetical protein